MQMAISDSRAVITDLHSSYGTFVNRTKLVPNQGALLHHGDEIKLGDSVLLKVIRINVSACVSRVPSRELLQKWLGIIGMKVQSSLENGGAYPTHLISSGSMTDKLLRALILGCAIVKPAWAQALASGDFVDPKTLDAVDYTPTPPKAENIFGYRGERDAFYDVDPNRRNLFHGKLFILESKTSDDKQAMSASSVLGVAMSRTMIMNLLVCG